MSACEENHHSSHQCAGSAFIFAFLAGFCTSSSSPVPSRALRSPAVRGFQQRHVLIQSQEAKVWWWGRVTVSLFSFIPHFSW